MRLKPRMKTNVRSTIALAFAVTTLALCLVPGVHSFDQPPPSARERAEPRPVAFQNISPASARTRFMPGADDKLTSLAERHDGGNLLPADQTLTWNTFFGGSADDYGYSVAVDGNGNVYVTGESFATWGSPVRAYSGGADSFVAKLDSSGNLIWNTFLGGNGNDDEGLGVAVDGSGNVYVAGSSNATWGSPVRAYSGDTDSFAAKLDSSGNLLWNTFLGSSRDDNGKAIAVDGSGNVHVTGFSNATWGSPVRAYGSSLDSFAAKLDSSGNLTWNTFLGGSGDDYGASVAVDGSGNVYVEGYSFATWGSPVRVYSGGADSFGVKLDSSGNLIWNTFLGGSGDDYGYGIAVDGSGNVYVTGDSNATWGSPVRAYSSNFDVFVAKLSGATPCDTPPTGM